ncbi:hypothetical protein LCGC14_2288540 [marine sediment metagenome]|uniref:histidine kinase n=1 Tax=marine sediment metagenome TaxID=412755 RepID=A0A0F9CRS3_9ZZZZ
MNVSEEKYKLITENAKDLIIVLDDQFIIEYVNGETLLNMLGYSREYFIGKTGSQFLHPDDLNNVLEQFNKRLELNEGGIEVRLHHKEGHYIWVETIGKVIVDEDKKSRVLVISRDINERKNLEQKLKKLEKNYRKSYYIAKFYRDLFTHDINNILNNISLSSELCTMFINQPEDKGKIIEFIGIISAQVNRGVNLISNIRKLSEIEESKIPIQSIELCQLLNQAINSLKDRTQDREVNIQINVNHKKIFVQANILLKNVFENILDNAVNYNKNPSVEILVNISKIQKEGQAYIKLEFIDNGIGISNAKKEIIFKKGDNEHKRGKGMGLGLSLVKGAIKTYNGQIWIEDRVKGDFTKGCNFVILIPEGVP